MLSIPKLIPEKKQGFAFFQLRIHTNLQIQMSLERLKKYNTELEKSLRLQLCKTQIALIFLL